MCLSAGGKGMNDALNTKILLTLYKRIPEEIRRNEKKVLKIASRSFYGYGAAETMKTYEKIIDMNDEKIRLINLKLLIDKAFNLLVSEDMRVIIMRFIKGLTFQEMADELDVSIRQVFRLYDTAITSFTTQLEYLKFPQEKNRRRVRRSDDLQGNLFQTLKRVRRDGLVTTIVVISVVVVVVGASVAAIIVTSSAVVVVVAVTASRTVVG